MEPCGRQADVSFTCARRNGGVTGFATLAAAAQLHARYHLIHLHPSLQCASHLSRSGELRSPLSCVWFQSQACASTHKDRVATCAIQASSRRISG